MENKTSITIKLGDWFQMFDNDKLTIENTTIDVTKPTNFDQLFPTLENIPNYQTCNLTDNYDFFATLGDGALNIRIIDDKNIGNFYHNCDYCQINIPSYAYPIRTCQECKKDMCSLCWEEKTEKIAIANGAKNWQSRKDKLLTCFSHQNKINITKELPINCDLCQKSSAAIFGTWFCNRSQNKDICPSCSYTEGQRFINSVYGQWNPTLYSPQILPFASFLNWILLYKDSENNTLLYNINKDSSLYHTVAFMVEDEHNRQGYFTVPGSLEENINKLSSKKIKEILSELNHRIEFF